MAMSEGDPTVSAGALGRAPTIYDVAAMAGVSHQTVSRYLKGEGVRPGNRERVTAALADLGYQPNLAARALATSKSTRIAVLTQEIGQIGPGRVLQGATKEAREAGYLLDIIPVDVSDRAAIDVVIRQANSQDVAGILALASTDEIIAAFEHAEFRVPAFIGAEQDDAEGEHPAQRNTRGMDLVIEHLAGLGHRRFFHVAGPRTWVAARNRELAFTQAVARHGGAVGGIVPGDWSAASGFDVASRVDLASGVTAIVAANDQMAIGAVLAFHRAGLDVPDGVSVTGFDDIPEAAFIWPPLTTVRLDFEDQGRDAFRRLIAQVEGRESSPQAMGAELVVRDSSGRVP